MYTVIRDQIFLGGNVEERSMVHERLLSVNVRKRRPGVQVDVAYTDGVISAQSNDSGMDLTIERQEIQ